MSDQPQHPANWQGLGTNTSAPNYGRMVLKASAWTGACMAWMIQYALWIPMVYAWIPMVWTWRFMVWSYNLIMNGAKAAVGGVAFIVLLCLPPFGWFILLLAAIGENKQAQIDNQKQIAKQKSIRDNHWSKRVREGIWSPWFLDALRAM